MKGQSESERTESLKSEARWLAEKSLSLEVSTQFCERYAQVLLAYNKSTMPAPFQSLTDWAREKRIDMGALEFFLRLKAPNNPISQRVWVLCFLCETDPLYYSKFVNERYSRWIGWWSLLRALSTSPLKLAKGYFFLKRFEFSHHSLRPIPLGTLNERVVV